MTTRRRLTPAIADIRRAVRAALLPSPTDLPPFRDDLPAFRNDGDSARDPGSAEEAGASSTESPSFRKGAARKGAAGDDTGGTGRGLVLVALSGGPDSLALAAATAFEAKRAGAVIVDHGLQEGSADAAARAAQQARDLGLDPVITKRANIVKYGVAGTGGPEAAARDARYAALAEAAAEAGAGHVLLGHTLDDQAETVLLGLARGSGAGSLKGMAAESGLFLRPLLGIRRSTTLQFCVDEGLEPWHDPQNDDPAFTRVRVRTTVLPMLEKELGPGIAEALARTAVMLREDADALDGFAEEQLEELAEHAEAGISLPVAALAANPPALRQRIIRATVHAEFGVSLSRAHTLEVCRLVTDWHGQQTLHLPGVKVERQGGLLIFASNREP